MSRVYSDIVADDFDDKIHIVHKQDVEPILQANKDVRSTRAGSRYGDMEKVASIPAVVVTAWMNEGINVMAPNREDLRRMKKKLNSPEWKHLRTRDNKI